MTATISGSFRRFLSGVADASEVLRGLHVDVLSPLGVEVEAETAGFLHLKGDRSRVVRVVQDGHLHAISASDFLWLVTDGYVGPSAAMEIGFAACCRVPVFADAVPSDVTLREYVTWVPSITSAVQLVRERRRP